MSTATGNYRHRPHNLGTSSTVNSNHWRYSDKRTTHAHSNDYRELAGPNFQASRADYLDKGQENSGKRGNWMGDVRMNS